MTRFDRIRNMELGQMADFLMDLNDGGERIDFCHDNPRCAELLETGDITHDMCHNCMVGWLLGEEDRDDAGTAQRAGQALFDSEGDCRGAGE